MAAYLGLYDPPFAHEANDALWACLGAHASALGLPAPPALDRTRAFREIWHDPALAFAQTCGLPLITTLRGQVRLLAAPIYDFPGCTGGQYRSLIVVRDDAAYATLADLRGACAAINARDSHSGCNALRHAIAPLVRDGAFFASHIETGAHVDSLRAVRSGRADACACDCITFGLIARHRPSWLAGLRVLDETEAAPAPPYVTRGAAADADVTRWREALRRTFADRDSADARAFLGLGGLAFPAIAAYSRIGDMMGEADGLGQQGIS